MPKLADENSNPKDMAKRNMDKNTKDFLLIHNANESYLKFQQARKHFLLHNYLIKLNNCLTKLNEYIRASNSRYNRKARLKSLYDVIQAQYVYLKDENRLDRVYSKKHHNIVSNAEAEVADLLHQFDILKQPHGLIAKVPSQTAKLIRNSKFFKDVNQNLSIQDLYIKRLHKIMHSNKDDLEAYTEYNQLEHEVIVVQKNRKSIFSDSDQ